MEKSKVFQTNKVKKIQYHQTSFTTNVNGTYIVKKYRRRKKSYKIKLRTIKKMAIGTYISLITLNVNVLNAQPKDTDWLNGYKNKTQIYAVYKKQTSDLKTHID